MNKRQLELCACLRQYTSEDAFSWLMANFPPGDPYTVGDALMLIPHRSWKRAEQIKLFDAYFSCSFPMGSRSMGVFSKFMSAALLTRMLKDFINSHLKDDKDKLSLANYRLRVFIGTSKNEELREHLKGVLDLIDIKLSTLRVDEARVGTPSV